MSTLRRHAICGDLPFQQPVRTACTPGYQQANASAATYDMGELLSPHKRRSGAEDASTIQNAYNPSPIVGL